MAWQFKVVEVSGSETRLEGEPPAPVEFDLTSIGMWRFRVEFFDSAAPGTTLYTHTFVEPSAGFDAGVALERILEIGRKVRDTRSLITTLQGIIGTVFDVTDAT